MLNNEIFPLWNQEQSKNVCSYYFFSILLEVVAIEIKQGEKRHIDQEQRHKTICWWHDY